MVLYKKKNHISVVFIHKSKVCIVYQIKIIPFKIPLSIEFNIVYFIYIMQHNLEIQ